MFRGARAEDAAEDGGDDDEDKDGHAEFYPVADGFLGRSSGGGVVVDGAVVLINRGIAGHGGVDVGGDAVEALRDEREKLAAEKKS